MQVKKTIAVAMLVLLAAFPLAVFAEADDEMPGVLPVKPVLRKLFLVGKGLAVSQSNAMDFKVVRAITGRVLVPWKANHSAAFVSRGVIELDKEKYSMENIDVVNDSITATLEKNGTEVGSLSVTRVEKPGQDIWAGTLTLNGEIYNLYLWGIAHPLYTPPKIVQAVRERVRDAVQNRTMEGKKCGPKLVPVNPLEIRRCKQKGGSMVTEKDENGCPLAPRCVMQGNATTTTTTSAPTSTTLNQTTTTLPTTTTTVEQTTTTTAEPTTTTTSTTTTTTAAGNSS
jgi:hypothetical protein